MASRQWIRGYAMLEVMQWPPQSADLNPIKHLWHHLKIRLREYDTLASGIAEVVGEGTKGVEWYSSICLPELIESMPRRVQAVLQAKGGYTKY